MSAQFENGFFVRDAAWHGLGTVVASAPSTADALRLAGLDWHVALEPMYLRSGVEVPNRRAVVRDSDASVLGDVSAAYVPAQPQQALDFMDDLLGAGLQLHTAGSLDGGRRIWLLSQAPERNVLGDVMQPYVGITTSFDGGSATQVFNTVTRVVCQNTLDMALGNAARKWSMRHTSSIAARVAEAARTMQLATDYVDALAAKAERYAATKVTTSEFNALVAEMFGDDTDMTTKERANRAHLLAQFGTALRQPDLDNFKGTAWHVYNAMGDFATHLDPVRKTGAWEERKWESFIDGNQFLLRTERALDALVVA